MRVLHLIDTTGPGGAETIFLQLVNGLRAHGVESIPAVLGPGWLKSALVARGCDPIEVRSAGRTMDVRYLGSLLRLIRDRRIDLVQTHLLGSAVYGALAGSLTGCPVVSTFHGVWDFEREKRLAWAKYFLLRWRVGMLVFVSEFVRDQFAAHAVLSSRKVSVIPNGVDLEQFRPHGDRTVRGELGVRDEELLVCAVGNVRPAKAYDVFVRAAALVQTISDRFRFVVVGDLGEDGATELRGIADTLGVGKRLTFVGFREDVADVLNSADIYVSTSDSEGFSLTAVQALACGVPVVATRSGGPERIVQEGRTGFLVPCRAPGLIADAILRLGLDEQLRRRFGVEARSSVADRFSVQTMCAAYMRVYDELLS